jgi:glucokinase
MIKMKNNTYWVGVDIGGTNTKVGFIDRFGNFLIQLDFRTNADAPPKKFVEKLRQILDSSQSRIDKSLKIGGIGLAAPNVNYLSGLIEAPVNFEWGTIDLVKLLKRHYDLPIRIIKDSNAAALGEMTHGLAKNMKNFIVITLGTGLGSGIVVNGEIVNGANGLAGEIGHTVAVDNGRHCACGRQGCLEAYVSANGICKTAIEMLSDKSYHSVLHNMNVNQLTAKVISEAAADGDELALQTLDFTAQILGRMLTDITAILNPEAFIITGGVANTGDLLLAPTRKYFESHLLPMYNGKIAILNSNMRDGQAAILGAASLVFDGNLRPE